MKNAVLPKVDDQIKKYQTDHQGEKPLYIVMANDDARNFLEEVKRKEGLQDDIVITEYKGTKVVSNQGMKPGDIQLTNELPDISG